MSKSLWKTKPFSTFNMSQSDGITMNATYRKISVSSNKKSLQIQLCWNDTSIDS